MQRPKRRKRRNHSRASRLVPLDGASRLVPLDGATRLVPLDGATRLVPLNGGRLADALQQLADCRDAPDIQAVDLAREQPTARGGSTADGQAAGAGAAGARAVRFVARA